MKKNIIGAALLCGLVTALYAHDPKDQSTVPSYAEFKAEQLDFKNSRQKKDGARYTATLQHQVDSHCFKVAFEMTTTNTKKPPLTEDLDVEKFYLRYTYHLNKQHIFNAGYIAVQDNLVPTDGGNVFNLGYNYILNQNSNIKFNLYYSHYDIFHSYQGDLAYQYTDVFDGFKTSMILEGKYIQIGDCQSGFCANAKEHYFTPGLRLKVIKNGYFIHGGAYFGKRAFAVMGEGFMLQHHAMEFSQTYMMGVGKRWKKYAVKFRYITQEAEELPYKNSGVTVKNLAMMLSYYF
jgi:hypothetical protein